MHNAILDQIDYVYFVYGMAFLYFGGVCLSMQHQCINGYCWKFLGYFGLLHGTCEWLDLISVCLGDNAEFLAVRTILKFISFVFLLQFSFGNKRSAVKHSVFAYIGTTSCIILYFLIAEHQGDADDLVRWLIAFPGAISVSIIFYNVSKNDNNVWLYMVAVAFLLYGIFSGLVVPSANISHYWPLSYDKFLNYVGVPIQIFRAAAASLSAVGIWRYDISQLANQSLVGRLQVHFWRTSASFVLALTFGYIITNFAQNIGDQPEYHRSLVILFTAIICAQITYQFTLTKMQINRELLLKIAEKENKEKSEFLAILNHEMRTPLNVIIGFSELIKSQQPEDINPNECIEFAEHILTSGQELLVLVSDIIDMTKIETGKVEINKSKISIHHFIQQVSRIHRARAGMKGIAYNIEPIDADLLFYADINAATRMLQNLLSNSIKFTPGGGTISIRSRRAIGGGAIIEVADTGVGMTQSDIERINENNFDTTQVFRQDDRNIGIGLAIVKELIALHGGSLQITSVQGHGSTFSLYFPDYLL